MKKWLLFCSISMVVLSCKCKDDDVEYKNRDERTLSNPNVILILGDDIGYEIPTYTGGQSHSTPNIDMMASGGVRFSNCNASPLCSPSRYMLLTGKYNNRNYGETSWGYMPLSYKTIANMMEANGYATCAVGKWQLDGGDAALKSFGFQNYAITNPFKEGLVEEGNSFYKNPVVYQDGIYLPASATNGLFGEDVMRNYMFDYITANKNKKFFIYWAPNLAHAPFTPTPDDAEFDSWIPKDNQILADSIYFPNMIRYYDKEIGLLIGKLNELNLMQNTVILHIMGDNGTNNNLNNKYKGQIIPGGKTFSTTYGTHVPFIAYSPGNIAPKEIKDMVDFVDFIPAVADLTNMPIPTFFGALDGFNFTPQIFGEKPTPRDAGFCYYDPNRSGPDTQLAKIWALDGSYKLYSDGRFYNYVQDPKEKRNLSDGGLLDSEKKIKDNLQKVIDRYQ